MIQIFNRKPISSVSLIILDGWGHAPAWGGNAISEARTPNFDYLWRKFPHTTLKASGSAVGLPGDEMGNSEVGHMTLGAGRIIPQDITRINQAIEHNGFFENKKLGQAVSFIKKSGGKLHLMGLLSDGGVHSHIKHLFALLEYIKKEDINKVYLHLFTDGRDTPPTSAQKYINKLKKKLSELKLKQVKIGTITGRYFAMDRGNNWERTDKTYQAIVSGRGQKAKDALSAISTYYRRGIYDEKIPPTVIDQEGVVEDRDAVIFFNFRADRARQISSFFIDPDLSVEREKTLSDIFFVSMVPYQSYDLATDDHSLFPLKKITDVLAQSIAEKGHKQFHCAETEKYAHVTYFFNGAREKAFENEDRVMVPSPKVDSYESKPEMSANQVCAEFLKNDDYRFKLVNFANPDMVGHTGNLKATIKAVEAVDIQLKKMLNRKKKGEVLMITADHGNAEEMIDRRTGKVNPEHTSNPVPFILISDNKQNLNDNVSLAGIAPAILNELKIAVPKEMSKINIYDQKEEKLT